MGDAKSDVTASRACHGYDVTNSDRDARHDFDGAFLDLPPFASLTVLFRTYQPWTKTC